MNVQSKKKMVYMTRINPFQSEVGLLHQFFLNGGISGSVVECLIFILLELTLFNQQLGNIRLRKSDISQWECSGLVVEC